MIEDNRRHNFYIMDNEIIDIYGPVIGPIGVSLYAALVRHAGPSNACYPSHDTLTQKVGISKRSAIEYLSRLAGEDKGKILATNNLVPLIRIIRRTRKDGGSSSNVYELLPVTKSAPEGVRQGNPEGASGSHKEDTVKQESSPNGDRLNTPAPKNDDLPDGFGDWYSVYPRKKSRGDAIRAWQKIDPSPDLVARMISAVERQKLSPDWLKDDGQYIPYPATWLNRECWLDEDPIPIGPTQVPASTEPDPYGNQMMEMIDNE